MDKDLSVIPRLNDCKTAQDVANLNHKLVQFDCQIQDEFGEEYFNPYLPRK